MPYKISGTNSNDCKTIILSSDYSTVLSTQDNVSGSYEHKNLTAEEKVVLGMSSSGEVKGFTGIVPEEYSNNYFGNGSDGILNTAGNVLFSSTTDGATVYKNFTSMSINSGHTVTVANRCKGLVIYCSGDCTINGALSMTARGCKGAGENFAPNGLDQIWLAAGGAENLTIPATGGAGGAKILNTSIRTGIVGANGTNATNGACGGGGSGGNFRWDNGNAYSGAGATGTTWCGGAGGGGINSNQTGTFYAPDGGVNGGAGGNGLITSGFTNALVTGGAGNNGGLSSQAGTNTYADAENGAGGLLILVVFGILTINGIIESKGSRGGYKTTGTAWPGCGGSSGGGSITVLHKGTLINNGSITATSPTNWSAGRGGYGSIRIRNIS